MSGNCALGTSIGVMILTRAITQKPFRSTWKNSVNVISTWFQVLRVSWNSRYRYYSSVFISNQLLLMTKHSHDWVCLLVSFVVSRFVRSTWSWRWNYQSWVMTNFMSLVLFPELSCIPQHIHYSLFDTTVQNPRENMWMRKNGWEF